MPPFIIFLRGKSQDSVRTLFEPLGLIKRQELERGALISLKRFLIRLLILGGYKLIQASDILPHEALEVGRPIRQAR